MTDTSRTQALDARSIPDREGPAEAVPAEASSAPAETRSWFLEARLEGGHLRRIPLTRLPFRIGRRLDAELVLPSGSVSKLHAEIYAQGGGLWLRDRGSMNGTFLNRVRLRRESALHEGAIVHIADFEFRLVAARSEAEPRAMSTTHTLRKVEPSPSFIEGNGEMKQLLLEGQIEPCFQPIVSLPRGGVMAFEALARGTHPGLPESPDALFRIAGEVGVERALSRLCRRIAVERLAKRAEPAVLFVNSHPAELECDGLVESMAELARLAPHLKLVLELHESALTDPRSLAALRGRLKQLDVGLAYDDFGAGEARLHEFAELPPDYLKFDLPFIQGIDTGPDSRRRLLASLVTAAREMLVEAVAEGVETAQEAEACIQLGFTHAQGYHYGEPAPAGDCEIPGTGGSHFSP